MIAKNKNDRIQTCIALLLFVAAPLEDLFVPEEGVAFEEDLLAEGVEEEAG